jgi:hypothetical protein
MRGTVSADLHLRTYSFTLRTKFGYPLSGCLLLSGNHFLWITQKVFIPRGSCSNDVQSFGIPACDAKIKNLSFILLTQIPITKKPFH